MNRTSNRVLRIAPLVLTTWLAFALGAVGSSESDAASTSLELALSPVPNYQNNENVTVSLGANSLFSSPAGLALHVVECADPRGVSANLPTKFYECDADTSTRVVTMRNGSFSTEFVMNTTPIQLEPADSLPKCNATHYCVVMVSADIADLAGQHVFSRPFLVGSTTRPKVAKLAAGPSTKTSGSSSTWWIATIVPLLVLLGLLWFVVRKRMARP